MAEDSLRLDVAGIEIQALTGVYSEETHQTQPLRVSLTVDLALPKTRFSPDSPLSLSKDYMDLKRAVTDSLPNGVHFTLVEAIADHICTTLFAQDDRVRRVSVQITKLAISHHGETIGIHLIRHRPA